MTREQNIRNKAAICLRSLASDLEHGMTTETLLKIYGDTQGNGHDPVLSCAFAMLIRLFEHDINHPDHSI